MLYQKIVLTQKYLLFAKKVAPGNIESATSQILFWCASLDFTFDTTFFIYKY